MRLGEVEREDDPNSWCWLAVVGVDLIGGGQGGESVLLRQTLEVTRWSEALRVP